MRISISARSLVESVGNLYGADGFGDVNSPLNLSPIPANYYWNPFGVPITAVTYGFPEGGPQVDDVDTSAWRLNLGLKGTLGIVHYDVGGSYYYNYGNAFDYNMPTNPGLYAAENRPGAAAVNLFCNACNTSAQIAGIFCRHQHPGLGGGRARQRACLRARLHAARRATSTSPPAPSIRGILT